MFKIISDLFKYGFGGYDSEGYDRQGYGRDGFNKSGYDRQGYGRDGFNKSGYDRQGYGRDGFNKSGYDRQNFDKNGFSEYGTHRDTKTEYDLYGKNREGNTIQDIYEEKISDFKKNSFMVLDEWDYEILIDKLNETSDYKYSSTNFGNYIERGDIVILLQNDFSILKLECDDSTTLVRRLTESRIGSTFMLFNGRYTIVIGKITS